jgi:VanZ family protein
MFQPCSKLHRIGGQREARSRHCLWPASGSPIFPGWRRAGPLAEKLAAYIPAAVWALVIAYFAGASALPTLPAIPHLDKAAHFGVYFVLGCLLGYGWLASGRWPGRVWLLLFALVLGVSDEVRQSRLPDRSAEVVDWAADAAGAISGLFFVTSFRRGRRIIERIGS